MRATVCRVPCVRIVPSRMTLAQATLHGDEMAKATTNPASVQRPTGRPPNANAPGIIVSVSIVITASAANAWTSAPVAVGRRRPTSRGATHRYRSSSLIVPNLGIALGYDVEAALERFGAPDPPSALELARR
jgi:hypothetical protein